MGQPVVHFEIIGNDPAKLRDYFARLFGWEYDTTSPVPDAISEPDGYGFIGNAMNGGIPGGIGGGHAFESRVLFYVGVDDVEAALSAAEKLGGARRLGPVASPNGTLVVGHFADPEGHLIGVAGPK